MKKETNNSQESRVKVIVGGFIIAMVSFISIWLNALFRFHSDYQLTETHLIINLLWGLVSFIGLSIMERGAYNEALK